MNWYELLKEVLRIGGDRVPFEAFLVDWSKAQALTEEISESTSADLWRVILDVGFIKERVLSVVDPSIRSIVSRMLDLPILTLNSCGGHTVEGVLEDTGLPYFSLVFKDPAFGSDFVRKMSERFMGNTSIEFEANGSMVECIWGIITVLLPFQVCLDHRLPISLNWRLTTTDPSVLIELWSGVAEVLDSFDHQGGFDSALSAFEAHADDPINETWVEELKKLP